MNWSMGSDCCTLDGLTSNKMTRSRDVIRLELTCSQLVGSIPPNNTLFQLAHLQSLNLNYNGTYGVLPEDIFYIPNSKRLSLRCNSNLIVILPKVTWRSRPAVTSRFLQIFKYLYLVEYLIR